MISNLNTCPNVEPVVQQTGWANWTEYLFWARQNEFDTGSGPFLDADQNSEAVYQMEREDGYRGPDLQEFDSVESPLVFREWVHYGPFRDDSPAYERPLQYGCDRPDRESRDAIVSQLWEKLESMLPKMNRGLHGSATKNDKMGAWLSDCALEVMEADDDDLAELFISVMETEELPESWEKRFNVLSFRRFCGFDVGEVIEPGKFYEEQKRATQKFWDKVPANNASEVDPEEHATAFLESLVEIACIDPVAEHSLLKTAFGLCMFPYLNSKATAKHLKMGKTTYYDNLKRLKDRLTVGLLHRTTV